METNPVASAGQYADVNGLKMYYEIHGTGDPLVLIHGGGSTMNTTFGKILPMLAATYRVIAVELQAHGRTSDRETPESFKQDAADIMELLTQLQIPKAHLLGFSNGGQTAIQAGIDYPDRVDKLIIASAFYKRAGVPEWFWPGFDQPDFNHLPQIYKDDFLRINNDPAALRNMFDRDVQRMRGFQDWTDADLRKIQSPALVVTGDQDLSSSEHAVEMHRLLKNSRLAILPGNHGSYMGEAMSPDPKSKVPELFVALVKEFLAA